MAIRALLRSQQPAEPGGDVFVRQEGKKKHNAEWNSRDKLVLFKLGTRIHTAGYVPANDTVRK